MMLGTFFNNNKATRKYTVEFYVTKLYFELVNLLNKENSKFYTVIIDFPKNIKKLI